MWSEKQNDTLKRVPFRLSSPPHPICEMKPGPPGSAPLQCLGSLGAGLLSRGVPGPCLSPPPEWQPQRAHLLLPSQQGETQIPLRSLQENRPFRVNVAYLAALGEAGLENLLESAATPGRSQPRCCSDRRPSQTKPGLMCVPSCCSHEMVLLA